MHISYEFYQSVNITCVCLLSQNKTGPSDGLYVYETPSFPFHTSCRTPAILDLERESQTRPARYYSISVQDCVPHAFVSYKTALDALGIQLISDFSLHFTKTATLSASSLHDLSPFLEKLRISSDGDVLVPELGALADLDTVRVLKLSRVQADLLPTKLNSLELNNTNYEQLPGGSINVIRLKIHENNLKSLEGSVPRLENISLDTPVLQSVNLVDADAEVLRGAWGGCPALVRLRLSRLRGRTLPPDLLQGAAQLTAFTLISTNFSDIPENFFSFSPNLTDIEISDNRRLKSIPMKLFMGLKLKYLMLMNNQLGSGILLPVTLSKLWLSGNPLGDLCSENGTSVIQALPSLHLLGLARTNATRICADWLRDAPALRVADLSHNAVRASCADLSVDNFVKRNRPYFDLTGNSLADFQCSREDYELAVAQQKVVQVIYQWSDANLRCSCGAYWLWRILKQSNDSATFKPTDKTSKCKQEWRVCHPEDEEKFTIDYEEGRSYRASCQTVALDDEERPRLPNLTSVKFVTLVACAPPPGGSYVAALRSLNVSVTNTFILYEVPAQGFSSSWLAGLPPSLTEIRLRAALKTPKEDNPAKSGRFRLLNLTTLPNDLLPLSLERVELRGTGLQTLGSEAFTQTTSLTIEEDHLSSFTGRVPELTRLWLSAPTLGLPEMPKLKWLILYNAAPVSLRGHTEMISVQLHQLQLTVLPPSFLLGCSSLVFFTANRNSFTSIPEDLFSYSLNLETINLSDNKLTALPSFLFKGLTKLTELNLENNQLSAVDLASVRDAPALKILKVSKNPLGDLCGAKNSILSSLTHLTHLSLSQTKSARVCYDWLHEMKRLHSLDLTGNSIRNLTCFDLSVQRDLEAHSPAPIIKLENNPIEAIFCSWLHHREVLGLQRPVKKVQITTSARLPCSCSTYWLNRVLVEPGTPVAVSAAYDGPCPKMARVCRVRTECLLDQPCASAGMSDDADIYEVNGERFVLEHDDGNHFNMTCTSTNMLEDPALPVFPQRTYFNTVSLHGCSPPKKVKYISVALLLLNVTIGENLYLYDLPPTAKFTSVSFDSMRSLKLLHLEAAEGILVIPKKIFSNVKPISSLHLVRVHSEELPNYLNQLSLIETGFNELQPGALLAKELTIVEKNRTTVLGNSWRLEKLSVTAPVYSLLTAPALQVLELTGAEPFAGFVAQYPKLHTLRLRRLTLLAMPTQFLRGATQLRHFEMTDSALRMLPDDFFSFTPNLETIDLSNNQLENIPKALFSGLTKVTLLNVANNPAASVDWSSLTAMQKIIL